MNQTPLCTADSHTITTTESTHNTNEQTYTHTAHTAQTACPLTNLANIDGLHRTGRVIGPNGGLKGLSLNGLVALHVLLAGRLVLGLQLDHALKVYQRLLVPP